MIAKTNTRESLIVTHKLLLYLVGDHELHHADRRLHLLPDEVHDQLLRHHHVADATSEHHLTHARVLVAELVAVKRGSSSDINDNDNIYRYPALIRVSGVLHVTANGGQAKTNKKRVLWYIGD